MKQYDKLLPMYCYQWTSFEDHYGRHPISIFELQDHLDAYSKIWINDYLVTSINYPFSGINDNENNIQQ